MATAKRDVGPIIRFFRDRLLRRKNINVLRFADEISPRTQPPPNLPDGPHSKLAENYYYTRDARRLVTPSEILAENGQILQIGDGMCTKHAKDRTPGNVHLWDK